MSSSSFRQRLVLEVLSKRNRLKTSSAQGFTLIELLVVIVILGVLGAVGYGAYIDQLQRANQNSAQIAAVAGAKNCAALLATGDAASFEAGVNTNQITIDFGAAAGADCKLTTTFNATAGAGAQLGTGGATIGSSGSVVPL